MNKAKNYLELQLYNHNNGYKKGAAWVITLYIDEVQYALQFGCFLNIIRGRADENYDRIISIIE